MTEDVTVTLIGGPMDGTVLHMSELLRTLRVPVDNPAGIASDRDMEVARYHLASDDAMGHASRDEHGRYRYRYDRTE